eukprot:9488517-Pyramimonas_sp.AAC.1
MAGPVLSRLIELLANARSVFKLRVGLINPGRSAINNCTSPIMPGTMVAFIQLPHAGERRRFCQACRGAHRIQRQ